MEEEFHSKNQMKTSHNTRQHFAFSQAHSRTNGPEATVIYTGQNFESNTFWHGLHNIFLSIGPGNGKEEKIAGIYFLQLFGMVCKLPVAQ